VRMASGEEVMINIYLMINYAAIIFQKIEYEHPLV